MRTDRKSHRPRWLNALLILQSIVAVVISVAMVLDIVGVV